MKYFLSQLKPLLVLYDWFRKDLLWLQLNGNVWVQSSYPYPFCFYQPSCLVQSGSIHHMLKLWHTHVCSAHRWSFGKERGTYHIGWLFSDVHHLAHTINWVCNLHRSNVSSAQRLCVHMGRGLLRNERCLLLWWQRSCSMVLKPRPKSYPLFACNRLDISVQQLVDLAKCLHE